MFENNPLLSRILAVGLLILALYGLMFEIAAPVIKAREAAYRDVERLRELAAEYEKRRPNIPALKQRLAGLRDTRASQDLYLTGKNATLVGARLQSRIKSLTEAAGGRLVSTQTFQRQEKDQVSQVAVRVQMTSSIGVIRQVFHSLEGGHPFLRIDNVTIRAPRTAYKRGRQQQADLLMVRYDVIGYLRNEAVR